MEVNAAETRWAALANIEETNNEKAIASLRDRLNGISLTEQQAKNEQINTLQQFLVQRAGLESSDANERLRFLREKRNYLLRSEKIFGDERIAMEIAIQNAISQIQEEQAERERNLLKTRLLGFSQFTGGFAKLLGEFGRRNRGAAIASRVMAIAEAAINSKLAFTRALASAPWPLNIPAAAGVLAAGMAQKIRIASTPIPSAETGGRFIVPQSRGVDSNLMRVNSGEEVNITPRGQSGLGEISQYIFKISEQVVFDIVNRGGRSGDIHVFEPAANY